MKKIILPFLLIAGLILTACVGKTTASPTVTRLAPTALVTVPAQSGLSGPDSGCTVVSRQPTPGPTQQSMFPPITDKDWTQGTPGAKVTLIEYSDFQ